MSKTTQCPACQTRFKVSDAQLSAANGLVRCGRCAHVFNANDYFIDPAPTTPAPRPAAQPVKPAPPAVPPAAVTPPAPAPAPAPVAAPAVEDIDDFELEVPDFDPDSAALPDSPPLDYPQNQEDSTMASGASREDVEAFQQALNQALQPHARPLHTAPIGNPFEDEEAELKEDPRNGLTPESPLDLQHDIPAMADSKRSAPVEAPEALPEPEPFVSEVPPQAPAEDLFDPEYVAVSKPRRPLVFALVLLLSLIGVLALTLQLAYLNRTQIASQAPELRPLMEQACRRLGCTVPLSTDIEFIRTEWSDLAFVPEHANLVQLSATLKNHASYVQALPVLEVTLKDANNLVLIRKVFTPRDYLKNEDKKLQSFAAGSQIKIVMRFDVGTVHAQGYSLYWFYP